KTRRGAGEPGARSRRRWPSQCSCPRSAVAPRHRLWLYPRHFQVGTSERERLAGFAGGRRTTPGNSSETGSIMTALWVIIACGALSIVYGAWAIRSVLSADAGSRKMQEISEAVREGAQAYLKRQYTTIAIVGAVMFIVIGISLGWLVAVGFLVGALLSGAAG